MSPAGSHDESAWTEASAHVKEYSGLEACYPILSYLTDENRGAAALGSLPEGREVPHRVRRTVLS